MAPGPTGGESKALRGVPLAMPWLQRAHRRARSLRQPGLSEPCGLLLLPEGRHAMNCDAERSKAPRGVQGSPWDSFCMSQKGLLQVIKIMDLNVGRP